MQIERLNNSVIDGAVLVAVIQLVNLFVPRPACQGLIAVGNRRSFINLNSANRTVPSFTPRPNQVDNNWNDGY